VFVDQVATSLLPIATHFVTTFDEASECLIATLTLGRDDWVVVFGDVKLQEVSRREVGFAF
jgi:hypothetical protein